MKFTGAHITGGTLQVHRFYLTKSTTPIIGWVASLLGLVMTALYSGLGIHNIGICITIFTFIVNIVLIPMTVKQQKTQKITSVMQPELAAIQAKYRNKTDQQSAARMQAETKAVYDKYGTSMTGGCAQLLIQLPILFALYQVIYRIPAYVPEVKALYETVAQPIIDAGLPSMIAQGNETIAAIVSNAKMGNNFTGEEINSVIDFLYKLTPEQWVSMKELFPALADAITKVAAESEEINTFLGINLSKSPWQGLRPNWAWLIPIFAGLSQWYSTYLMTKGQPQPDPNDQTAASMKAMNTTMPLMSVFFCFSLPAAIGVYWVASSVARTLIQIVINKHLSGMDVAQIVEENIEKTNKKRAKKGLPPVKANAKSIEIAETRQDVQAAEERQVELRKESSARHQESSNAYYNLNADPNSLTARANMVLLYNQRQEELKRGKKGGSSKKAAETVQAAAEEAEAKAAETAAAEPVTEPMPAETAAPETVAAEEAVAEAAEEAVAETEVPEAAVADGPAEQTENKEE
jgi:YidC/Oxa1 family membrane protein insertase